MSIILTRKGFEKFSNELNHLLRVERPQATQMIEDTRPIGVVEDNPEFMQAIGNQNRIEKRIQDITDILSDAILFNLTMNKKDIVSFGSTVELINEDTNVTKVYTIVSTYESDVANGFLSIECPFVKSMLGYKVGEEFEYNDNYYIINDITCNLSED